MIRSPEIPESEICIKSRKFTLGLERRSPRLLLKERHAKKKKKNVPSYRLFTLWFTIIYLVCVKSRRRIFVSASVFGYLRSKRSWELARSQQGWILASVWRPVYDIMYISLTTIFSRRKEEGKKITSSLLSRIRICASRYIIKPTYYIHKAYNRKIDSISETSKHVNSHVADLIYAQLLIKHGDSTKLVSSIIRIS